MEQRRGWLWSCGGGGTAVLRSGSRSQEDGQDLTRTLRLRSNLRGKRKGQACHVTKSRA